jgi:hypothetical protein
LYSDFVAAKVKLSDIVDALEIASDEVSSFVDRETGEVLSIQHEFLTQAEEQDAPAEGTPKWQVDAYSEALQVHQNPDRYAELPTQFDVHEYSIMEEFCRSVENPNLRVELLNAISGRGAFRSFKDTIHRRGIQDAWYAFRDEALRNIAREWCEEEGILFE